MKLTNNPEFRSWMSKLLLIVCGIIAYTAINSLPQIFTAAGLALRYISPFIAGIIIAYLLDIPCTRIEKLINRAGDGILRKHARGLAVIVTYVATIALIIFAMRMLIPEVVRSVLEFVANFQVYFQRITDFISDITRNEALVKALGFEAFISELTLKSILETIGYNSLWNSIISILSVSAYLFNITVAVISSVYLLLEARAISGFFSKVVHVFIPNKNVDILFRYLNKTNQYFKKFIYCTLIDGFIIGLLSVVGLFVIDTRYAVVLGILEGALNMIPYFGAIVGSVIVVIIVLLTDGLGKAAAVGLFLFLLQQVDGNLIKIKLYGDSFQISPFLVLFSITIGGAFYGVVGMVVAIPVVAIIKTMLDDAIEYKMKKNAERVKTEEKSSEITA